MSYQSAYRKARQKALKEILEPAGFRKGKEMLVRQTSGQLHGIEFQPGYGGEYFVNLAFSYDFLPPFASALSGGEPSLQDYFLLDFLLHTRIGFFLPGAYQDSWTYHDKDATAIWEQLAGHSRKSIEILDDLGRQWSDPTVFLTLVPPDMLLKDLQMKLADYAARQKGAPWSRGPFPVSEALGKAWHVSHFEFAFAFALVAKSVHKVELATEYLRVAETAADQYQQRLLERLRRQLAV